MPAFVSGYLESKDYMEKPNNLGDLKANITTKTKEINWFTCKNENENYTRIDVCKCDRIDDLKNTFSCLITIEHTEKFKLQTLKNNQNFFFFFKFKVLYVPECAASDSNEFRYQTPKRVQLYVILYILNYYVIVQ